MCTQEWHVIRTFVLVSILMVTHHFGEPFLRTQKMYENTHESNLSKVINVDDKKFLKSLTMYILGSTLSSNCTIIGTNDGYIDREVFLNVYDLTPLNSYSIWFGFGVFHTGIEVYGMEYGFGAHDYSISGVFEVEPKCCPGFSYRCSISLGYTNMSVVEFREFIEAMASDYHGDTYHLISKNCNHFTDDISQRVTGKRIPGWVNRLAKLDDYGTDSASTSSSHEASENDELDHKVLLSPAPEIVLIREVPR